MLLITAQDDPFVPYDSFLAARVEENPQVRFVAPEHGGHCGFVSRWSGEERFWAEERMVEFVEREVRRRVQSVEKLRELSIRVMAYARSLIRQISGSKVGNERTSFFASKSEKAVLQNQPTGFSRETWKPGVRSWAGPLVAMTMSSSQRMPNSPGM